MQPSEDVRRRDEAAAASRASAGRALMLVGVGHGVWGLIAYRKALREIARAGWLDSVGDGIFRREHADDARAAAFWFMFVAPMVSALGYLAERARQAGDAAALETSGWTVAALGVVGITAIPRSGFPLAPPIAYWLIREGRQARAAG